MTLPHEPNGPRYSDTEQQLKNLLRLSRSKRQRLCGQSRGGL